MKGASRNLEQLRHAATTAAEKTPTVVVDAFVPEPVQVAGMELRPISIQTWLFLEKIKSPFTKAIAKDAEIPFKEILSTMYVIVAPVEEVGAAIRRGNEAFEAAVEVFASKIPFRHLEAVATALAKHIADEFAPGAEMVRAEEAGTGGDDPLDQRSASETGPAAS